MRIQLSLTVSESKRILAKGIQHHPAVTRALKEGKVVLKGGTTTSAIAEEICGQPLRLSGRLTQGGALTAHNREGGPHSIIIERGRCLRGIDECWDEVVRDLRAGDVYITGANAIDAWGNAGLLAGVQKGGSPGSALSSLYVEGVTIIIAAGTEKMVLGDLRTVFPQVGRTQVDQSYGAAVGLLPLMGTVFTEIDAIPLLAEVRCLLIAKGGIAGMEGGTTLVVEGEPEEVEKIDRLYQAVKGSGISGIAESLPDCEFPSSHCQKHVACIYKRGKRSCFP